MAVATIAAAVAGVVAGAGARMLLRRLRRGADIRPPWCELAVALLWAAVAATWAAGWLPTAWLPAAAGLSWLAVAAGGTDVRHGRLPDPLTLPALPAALGLLSPLGPAALTRAVAGAVLAAAVHAAVHLVARGAVGAGDVKLAAPLGAVLAAAAWSALPVAAVLAAVFTAAVAVVRRRAPGHGHPHGPSMLLATWLVVLTMAGQAGPATGG